MLEARELTKSYASVPAVEDVSLIAIVLIAWYVLSRFQQEGEEIGNELIFEDNAPASFELLDLGRGS